MCQPVSVAGSRKGDGDERWLWNEFAECIRILRPKWVLAENVPGLLSAASGRLFRGILFDLSEMGFDAEWGTLPAAAFGAPHLRERVFIVAHTNKPGREEQWPAVANGKKLAAAKCGSETSSDTNCKFRAKRNQQQETGQQTPYRDNNSRRCFQDWRFIEPVIRRGDHGVPSRVDRLRCLGNAVVPQVSQWLGERILAYEKDLQKMRERKDEV